jgi:putative glutamine amidotransferase
VFARGIHPFHGVGEKYINAVVHGCDGLPLLLPASGAGGDLTGDAPYRVEQLLDGLDGLLLPGSPSNIEPHHYGASRADDGKADPQRDHLTLALVRAAVARQLPVLAICRGFQELNVALGGSLHGQLCDQPGFIEHREDTTQSRAEQYAPAHRVELAGAGLLASWLGQNDWQVNSLHGQGVDRLAPGLAIEARAEDGLVEAVQLPGGGWVVGVQWHPEWQFANDRLSRRLFEEFGRAARRYAEKN